nr:hypothetical protein [uncultured Sphaerochaeta sp.]
MSKQYHKNTVLVLGLLCILVLFSGCQDEIIDEILRYSDYRAGLYAPIDQDEVTMVPGHGKDSFSPFVEGFVWKVSINGYEPHETGRNLGESILQTIEFDPDNPSDIFYRIENIFDGGYQEFRRRGSTSSTSGGRVFYIPAFLTNRQDNLDWEMSNERAQSILGQTITITENRSEYTYEETTTYGNEFESFVTPFGKRYDTCLHVEKTYNIPKEFVYEPYITFQEYYIAKGIGFVYLKNIYNNGEEIQLVLVDHSSFGETLTFDMNTTETVSKTIAPKVYIEGEHVALPNVEREGYVLSSWQAIVDDQVIGTYEPGSSFSMGDKDVTMKAVWIAE